MRLPVRLATASAALLVVIAMVAYAAYTLQYSIEPVGGDLSEHSEALGISALGWEPVGVVGHKIKKKTTKKKKATYWHKIRNLGWMETTLPGLDAEGRSYAKGLVRKGRQWINRYAVGAAEDGGGVQHAVLWTQMQDGTWMIQALPGAGGPAAEAAKVLIDTNLMLLCGWAENPDGTPDAAVWSNESGTFALTPLPDYNDVHASHAYDAVVDSWTDPPHATVVGSAENTAGQIVAQYWEWTPEGWMRTDLPLLPGGDFAEARVVGYSPMGAYPNGLHVAGTAGDAGGNMRPVAWTYEAGAWSVMDISVGEGWENFFVESGLLGNVGEAEMRMDDDYLVGWNANLMGKKKATLWRKVKTADVWMTEDLAAITPEDSIAPQVATAVDANGRVVGWGKAVPFTLTAVAAADTDSTSPYAFLLTPDPPTGVGETVPATAALEIEARPNPFNPIVTVSFRVARTEEATLTVHDLEGRRVATLYEGVVLSGQENTLTWSGRDEMGEDVASGVYFLRLTSRSGEATRKIMMLK
jgi:hypothetical protein